MFFDLFKRTGKMWIVYVAIFLNNKWLFQRWLMIELQLLNYNI